MLKAHQACIDLEKNVLRIQNREVRFLSEHELPDKARIVELGDELPSETAGPSAGAGPSAAPTGSRRSQPTFPGGGNTIGATPSPVAGVGGRGAGRPAPASSSASRHPEKDIRVLMDLGATREVAISTLAAAGGNLDVAASLLF